MYEGSVLQTRHVKQRVDAIEVSYSVEGNVQYGGVEPKPTKKGIALPIPEWIELLRLVDINNTYPDLATALPCYMELDHSSQMSALKCSGCYPFVDTDII